MDENQLPKAFAAIEKIKQNGFLQNFLEFKLKRKDGGYVGLRPILRWYSKMETSMRF